MKNMNSESTNHEVITDNLDRYFNTDSIFRSVTNQKDQSKISQNFLKFEDGDFQLATESGISFKESKIGTKEISREIPQINPKSNSVLSQHDYGICDNEISNIRYQYDETISKTSSGNRTTFHPSGFPMPQTSEGTTDVINELYDQNQNDSLLASVFNSVNLQRSFSADNLVTVPKEKESLRPPELKSKSSSTDNIPFRNEKQTSSEVKLLKCCKTLGKKKPAYSYVRTIKSPQRCSTGCSCNMVTTIAPVNADTFWLGFRDSRAIILCTMTGDVLLVVNVGASVDDIIRSSSGDLYISCPKVKCIKVIRQWDPNTVEVFVDLSNTPWHPRGLATCPGDNAIVACLASSAIAHSTVNHTNNCLMKFETTTDDHEGCLVTNEKCFGYPLRVAVSSINNIIVSDFGFQCLTILNSDGLVIAKLTEINEVQISRRIAISFNTEDNIVVVQGRQPTLTVLKLDGSPLSVEDNNLPELTNYAVTAIAYAGSKRLLVGGSTGVIKVLKRH